MNMSYCRFHNTVIDVRDCLDALRYDEEKLSEEEMLACRELFETFIDFCYDNGILEEDYNAMEERLNEFLQDIEQEDR